VMALARLGQSLARLLHRPLYLPPTPPPLEYYHASVVRSFAPTHTGACLKGFASLTYNASSMIGHKLGGPSPVHIVKVLDLVVHLDHTRLMSTAAASKPKMPSARARRVSRKLVMTSPGFVYEPYSPRESIPFWKRWFTLSGWRRTKEDIIFEMKNAYAVSRLRKKTGYTKKQFYAEALNIYKEVNTLMAHGDTSALRKILTERMHSTIKNELKRRQSKWSSVHWELVEPAVSIRTLRARMIGLDKKDLDKGFVQLTLEFVTKQKFEAYNSKGEVVSGDKSKEVLVKDIWVFERSLFHPGAYWRVCGRITL
jgi:large subunit ribosomal protein L45